MKQFSQSEVVRLLAEKGLPKFRADQVLQWMYQKGVFDYSQMTNLSKALREELAESFPLAPAEEVDKRISIDGTRKYVLRFEDNACVETVAMPSTENSQKDRLSVCFSTQVGCAMACAFCATGQEGFTRNLSAGEMVEQILHAQKDIGERVTNVVAMGQGEPFLNYDNTLEALHIINNKKFLGIGARHITVSTCGVIKGIDQFANEPEQFTLAISLHAARQEVRDKLMPHVASQPLPQLKKALERYIEKTNRRPSFEYLLMQGVNDSEEDLEALLTFCDGLLCHVNLLPLNEVPGSPLKPASPQTVRLWTNTLGQHHIEATLRKSHGSDIAGACGQLKNTIWKNLRLKTKK